MLCDSNSDFGLSFYFRLINKADMNIVTQVKVIQMSWL